MFLEQLIVEVGILREGVLHIAVQVDAQQSAGVVRTQGNLTTRIRGNGAEAQIGIAIGNALPQDSVPEQHTRLGTLPSVVNYLLPEFLGADFFLNIGIVARYRELLYIGLVFRSTAHELIVNLHRNVGARHLAFRHLGIDESLRIRMLDAHTQHQGSATTVLSHLARTITITLHERNQTRRGQRRVVHRRTFRTDMAQVVTYATATFHQLHLLFIDTHHGTI